jgi:hypothetical protein
MALAWRSCDYLADDAEGTRDGHAPRRPQAGGGGRHSLLPRGIAEAAEGAATTAVGKTAAAAAGRFFTAPEMALLDELVELIIPGDAHSGGARGRGRLHRRPSRPVRSRHPVLKADMAGRRALPRWTRSPARPGKTFPRPRPEQTALLERIAKPSLPRS